MKSQAKLKTAEEYVNTQCGLADTSGNIDGKSPGRGRNKLPIYLLGFFITYNATYLKTRFYLLRLLRLLY